MENQTDGRWVTLIGMSGAGKSHLSKLLENGGYTRICIDDLIERALKARYGEGWDPFNSVADWMGLPGDGSYRDRAQEYLLLESELMARTLGGLEALAGEKPKRLVLDTTGSVIYTAEWIMEKARTLTTVIHLETPPETWEAMYRDFMVDPTPLIWRTAKEGIIDFRPEDTRADQYFDLLRERETLYEHWADVSLSHRSLWQSGFDIFAFLDGLGRDG